MKKINKISLIVLIIFSIGFLGSFIVDYIVSINGFGDNICGQITKDHHWHGMFSGAKCYGETILWGARHYWYNWGVACLFIVSLFRIGIIIDE